MCVSVGETVRDLSKETCVVLGVILTGGLSGVLGDFGVTVNRKLGCNADLAASVFAHYFDTRPPSLFAVYGVP